MKKNPYYVASGGIEPLGHYYSHNSIKDAITIVCAGSIGNVFFHKENFWCSDNSVKLNIKEEKINIEDIMENIEENKKNIAQLEKQINAYL